MTDQAVIRYARSLGSFPRVSTETWALVGQDGGQSIDLGGAALFVFSDTLLVPLRAHPHAETSPRPHALATDEPSLFLANCAATAPAGDLRQSLERLCYLCDPEGFPREILPPTADERGAKLRFWPEHGVLIDGTVYLYYLGVQTTDGSDIWGFRNDGAGLAALDPETGEVERIRARGKWRLWPPLSDDLHFGVQVVRHGDHVYVFGSQRRGLDVWGIVGRVPVDLITEPAAYTYLRPADGCWVAGLENAGSLGPCASEYSIAFNPYLGKYLMVYVDGFTKELALRLAEDPAGPYSAPTTVGRLPHRPSSELIYLGFQHPPFARDDGRRVYVSYCQPSFARASLVELCFR